MRPEGVVVPEVVVIGLGIIPGAPVTPDRLARRRADLGVEPMARSASDPVQSRGNPLSPRRRGRRIDGRQGRRNRLPLPGEAARPRDLSGTEVGPGPIAICDRHLAMFGLGWRQVHERESRPDQGPERIIDLALAVGVHPAQPEHRRGDALIGRGREQLVRIVEVVGDLVAPHIDIAKRRLGRGMALVRRLPIPIDRGVDVGRNQAALFKHPAQGELRVRIALVGRLAPGPDLRLVGGAVAHEIPSHGESLHAATTLATGVWPRPVP